MQARYGKIQAKRFSDQVFEHIRDLVFQGDLEPGQQLLPERELAKAMGVSRPTIREAVRRLVDRGLLEHRQGRGTFVRDPESARIANPLSLMLDDNAPTLAELMDVRLGLECNSAMLAARHSTAEDVAKIEESHNEMRSSHTKGVLPFTQEARFHVAIAYAGRNMLQVHLVKYLNDLIEGVLENGEESLFDSPAIVNSVFSQHEKILEAIRSHDALAAFHAMRTHVASSIDSIATRSLLLARKGRVSPMGTLREDTG